MTEAILVVVWKHRSLADGGQMPVQLQDFVGVVMLADGEQFNDRLQAVIARRFGVGRFSCMPDPPSRVRDLGWGSGGLSVRVPASV